MDTSAQTDAELVARSRDATDATAFAELLARYQRPVLNFCYRLLSNNSDAADVAQEVFVRVWQHLADYDPRQKFSTWLFALARHAAIDRLRWRKRHPSEPLAAAELLPGRASVTGDVQARETGDQIAAAVAALPEDQRTALVLAEYHGLSQAEIGDIMHCSAKSVDSRLYRARQTLRARLAHLLA